MVGMYWLHRAWHTRARLCGVTYIPALAGLRGTGPSVREGISASKEGASHVDKVDGNPVFVPHDPSGSLGVRRQERFDDADAGPDCKRQLRGGHEGHQRAGRRGQGAQ